MSIVSLIIFRDELRARLRRTYPTGVPLLADAAAMISGYLAAERDLGRIAPGAVERVMATAIAGVAPA